MKPTALVTGAAVRLGRTISLALADRGYDLVLHYHHSYEQARSLLGEVERKGNTGRLVKADLCRPGEWTKLTNLIDQSGDVLNLIVNNASLFETGTLLSTSLDELNRNMNIHFLAPMSLTQAFAAKQGNGQVINILDKAILEHDDDRFAYLLSKKILAEFTLIAAKTLAPTIRVNAIAPGFILPPQIGMSEDRKRMLIASIPLYRQGSPENIVTALHYLLDNDFVTGQILYVDGGATL